MVYTLKKSTVQNRQTYIRLKKKSAKTGEKSLF
jgi:hypothetical protein